jgi:CBS domain-containing protein
VRLDELVDPPVMVSPTTPVDEVARVMLVNRADSAIVIDDSGTMCGVICDAAFVPEEHHFPLGGGRAHKLFREWTSPAEIEVTYAAASRLTAVEVMRIPQVLATVDEPVGNVLGRMAQAGADCAPVLRDGTVVGALGRRAFLRLAAWPAAPSDHTPRSIQVRRRRKDSDDRVTKARARFAPAT